MTVRSSGWGSLPTSRGSWDEGAARRALDAWAGDNMGKYARGFLWVGGDPALKTSYKFPIAMPVNGKLTVFASAVAAAKSYLNRGNIPSADKAKIATILDRLSESYREGEQMSLVASAPVHPPKAWFNRPKITGSTKVVVTDDGQVYGWVAPDTCHRGALSAAGYCQMPPRSRNGYSNFHTGSTKTAEGDLLHTGVIVWDTTHADESYGARRAVAHYEDTGQAVADVRVGDLDGGGIWFAGGMRPGASDAAFQKMRQSPPSGDWRNLNGNLELVAVLATNTPGFPVLASVGDGEESVWADLDAGDVIFRVDEEGRQVCLIASFAVFAADEDDQDEQDPADEETDTEDEDEDEAEMASKPDDDCDCPGKKLAGYELLLTPQELKDRQTLLTEFAPLGV